MSVGKYLQSKRESSGTTLKSMQSSSGLRKEIITTIENDDFNQLPKPEYAEFLITKYARALGLNGETIVERYRDEIPQNEQKEIKRHQSDSEDYLYYKSVLISFLVIVFVLFIIWIVLLQVGTQANVFQSQKIYEVNHVDFYSICLRSLIQ